MLHTILAAATQSAATASASTRSEVIAITALTVSVVSIVFNIILSVLLHRNNSYRSKYDFIDTQIADIIKIQMDYPDYRRDNFLATLKEGDAEMLRYEAFCCLVWNSLETVYEKYGEKRLKGSTFFPAMQSLARRHKPWMDKIKGEGYSLKMRQFLLE
jgi:hypothetical protein